jgi:hypothetical protein
MGTRTSAERDAATVEIVFALVSAAFLAALAGGAAVAVTLALRMPAEVVPSGAGLAAVVFAARVLRVLTAWRLRTRTAAGGSHPSQPGRTSPVS